VDLEEARRKVEELRREIEKHDYYYYVLDSPLITDEEYDALYSNSWSSKSAFRSWLHLIPRLSV